MNYRIATSTLALALTACFASASYAAAGPRANAPAVTTPTTNNSTAKVKLISFHLRNDSGSALTLQVGEQQITVEAGKTANVKAPEGVKIVAVNASEHVAAGGVLVTVSQMLSGNTVAVN